MNNNTSPFIRKIIYIALIGALLVPLSMVSRPAMRGANGEIKDAGGKLSMLREDYDLSQAKISEIDPASETMKLASLGLRGVAVNMLWMQAMEHKKKENYDQLASTLQALTKIQPNFVKVWEYQAHNLAYNVSMEFDDYEYRYSWVKKGLQFLKQGIPYNKRDHRVLDKLGFFTSNKFGKSDETLSFRRMFRKDEDFHLSMSDYVDPEAIVERQYGPDSWLMSWHFHEIARKMVEEQSCPQRTSDMLFHMYRPSRIRGEAMSLQKEYRTGEVIQEVWRRADERWRIYGDREITNTRGISFQLEGLKKDQDKIAKLRQDLDKLVRPGLRSDLIEDIMAQANFKEEDKALYKMSADELSDEDIRRQTSLMRAVEDLSARIDIEIAEEVENSSDLTAAQKLAYEIGVLKDQISAIQKDSSTVNYSYWRVRNEAESSDICVRARQTLYDAEQMWGQSIYDDEYDFDFKTKQKSVTKRGAISLYLSAFEQWQEVFDLYGYELQAGVLGSEIVDSIKRFSNMLNLTNRSWPEEFPLQRFIDYRATQNLDDGLPTSDVLEEIRSGLREQIEEAEDDSNADDSTAEDSAEVDSTEGNKTENEN